MMDCCKMNFWAGLGILAIFSILALLHYKAMEWSGKRTQENMMDHCRQVCICPAEEK